MRLTLALPIAFVWTINMTSETVMYTVSEINPDGFIDEIETTYDIDEAFSLLAALMDSDGLQYAVVAHKYVCGFRVT